MKRFILASASPRRKELLRQLIKDFEILPAVGEERADPSDPEKYVAALAGQKAEEIAARSSSFGAAVLGADTVVVYGGKIFGKPKTEADAFTMLKALSGHTHEVLTGVHIVFDAGTDRQSVRRGVERTKVEFYELSDGFIKAYIQSGSPMDKAGAYGIQDGGLVKEILGSYSNVVGLPLELTERLLRRDYD